MRKISLFTVSLTSVLLLSSCVNSQIKKNDSGLDEITLVESVPAETVYGSSLTQRPQQVWVEMINSAQKTLDFEEYYIADQENEALRPVIEAVKKASARGVRVRFLVDSGMYRESKKTVPELEAAGVDLKIINFGKYANFRNLKSGGIQHSKFFIVDGKEVYVGSQNFDWRSLKHIHELGARIKSVAAAENFAQIFNGDWEIANGGNAVELFGKKAASPINSKNRRGALLNGDKIEYSLAFGPRGLVNPGFDSEIDAFIDLIKNAKKTLHGQVMSYSLDEYYPEKWTELNDAIVAAGKRGVKVELVFADWTLGKKNKKDPKTGVKFNPDDDIKALGASENVNIKISSLPEYSEGFIEFARVEHLKYMVADGDKGYISTSNWGPSYFLTTRGAAVILYGKSAGDILEDVFSKAWNGPYVSDLQQNWKYKSVVRTQSQKDKEEAKKQKETGNAAAEPAQVSSEDETAADAGEGK